jgi:hypothetical protein
MPIAGPRRMAGGSPRRDPRHPVLPRRLHGTGGNRRHRLPEHAYQNKEIVYGILFRTAAETLRTIAADPRHLGAEIGFFSVLHSAAYRPQPKGAIPRWSGFDLGISTLTIG